MSAVGGVGKASRGLLGERGREEIGKGEQGMGFLRIGREWASPGEKNSQGRTGGGITEGEQAVSSPREGRE